MRPHQLGRRSRRQPRRLASVSPAGPGFQKDAPDVSRHFRTPMCRIASVHPEAPVVSRPYCLERRGCLVARPASLPLRLDAGQRCRGPPGRHGVSRPGPELRRWRQQAHRHARQTTGPRLHTRTRTHARTHAHVLLVATLADHGHSLRTAKMSSLSRRACYKCGNVGHYAEVCSSAERLCYNCKQPGHESNGCPLPRTTEAKQCYHCQGLGHVQADCPTLRLSGNATSGRCYNCGQPGHLAVRRPPFQPPLLSPHLPSTDSSRG